MTGRPQDLLSDDTSARLHARAVAVKRRLEGRGALVLAAFPARPWCRAWHLGEACSAVDAGSDGPMVLKCQSGRCARLREVTGHGLPRDVIELARVAAGLSFDDACTRLEALADALDRAELTAAGQGELF